MAGKTTMKMIMLLALVALASGCSSDDPASPVNIDTAPPAVPSNLSASYAGAQGGVYLSWDANTVDGDLAGYLVDKVYRGETMPLVASPIQQPGCQDPNPGNGVTVYHVYAVDQSGNQSAVATATISLVGSHPSGNPDAH